MQQEFENTTFLVGNKDVLLQIDHTPVLPVFSEEVVEFLAKLSYELLHDEHAKMYGDVIAYAFWIREKSLEKEQKKYISDVARVGRGMAFQIAPSNIPVQFAVSMTYAMIAGNVSVIRVSSKYFEQVEIICRVINKVIRNFCSEMEKYICIFRCSHDDLITQWLSQKCDIRMVWGGNDTINLIRQTPISPRSIEIGFADRYSFAVIDSEYYLKMDSKIVASDFYNDTFYTDQNACSSTRLVIWTGTNVEKAKELFWNSLEDEVAKKYKLSEISGSEKLLKIAICAAKHPGIKQYKKNNAIVRVNLPKLYDDIMDYKGNCGYFFEYHTTNLEEIVPLLKKECQTITFLGNNLYDEINNIVVSYGVRGVDRVVPMGHSMDLSFVWDGYDMPITLSRVVGNI